MFYTARGFRRGINGAAALLVALAVLMAGCAGAKNTDRETAPPANGDAAGQPEASQPADENAGVVDADLVIPLAELSATARFYPVTVEGTRMEIIAVKTPDGLVRTAFNTCQVCYDSGRGYYKQVGDLLVCQNCGNKFPMSQVEVKAGGCNPWPIFNEDKTLTDDTITISYAFLKESKAIFARWKTVY